MRLAAAARSLRPIHGAALLGLVVYAGLMSKLNVAPAFGWVMGAVFVAATLSSIGGFAFSAICGAMLFHIVREPALAVQIMMVCSVAGQSLMVWSLRHEIDWHALGGFLLGGAFGLPLGIFILLNSPPTLYLQIIGVMLVAYAGYKIVRRDAVLRHQHALWDVVAGLVGGITGGVAAFPGAAVTIWCGLKGWSKERQRGVYQPFILIVQLAGLVLLSVVGRDAAGRAGFDFAALTYLPAMLLGVSFGMLLFRWLSDRQFALGVNVLLIASGLALLI